MVGYHPGTVAPSAADGFSLKPFNVRVPEKLLNTKRLLWVSTKA